MKRSFLVPRNMTPDRYLDLHNDMNSSENNNNECKCIYIKFLEFLKKETGRNFGRQNP